MPSTEPRNTAVVYACRLCGHRHSAEQAQAHVPCAHCGNKQTSWLIQAEPVLPHLEDCALSYNASVVALCNVLATANMADSDQAQSWQRAQDSSGIRTEFHGLLAQALLKLAGPEFCECFWSTNEIVLSLADRNGA